MLDRAAEMTSFLAALFYPANKKCNQPPSASDSAVASPSTTEPEHAAPLMLNVTEPLRDPGCFFYFIFIFDSGSLGGGEGATDGG